MTAHCTLGRGIFCATDLRWRTNEQTKLTEWRDGAQWVEGDWSDEYQKGKF